MSLDPANDLGPYPADCTDASWKLAKTEKKGDKWRTNVGAALRAAATAYNKVDAELLDVSIYTNKRPGQRIWDDPKFVAEATQRAKQHHSAVVKPAIKALSAAITSAKVTSANPVISTQSRLKARQIVQDLTPRLAQLKSFHLRDYQHKKAEVEQNLKNSYNQFSVSLNAALKNASKFSDDVSDDPSPAVFNKHIQSAARRITQNIGQVEKMMNNGLDLGKDAKRATALFRQLEPWANGQVSLPLNASESKVRSKLIEFDNLVSDVKRWWGA